MSRAVRAAMAHVSSLQNGTDIFFSKSKFAFSFSLFLPLLLVQKKVWKQRV